MEAVQQLFSVKSKSLQKEQLEAYEICKFFVRLDNLLASIGCSSLLVKYLLAAKSSGPFGLLSGVAPRASSPFPLEDG